MIWIHQIEKSTKGNQNMDKEIKSPKLIMARYLNDEIKNLGFVRPFTNSEKLALPCTRNYTFDYVENFATDRINENFAYGSCWHLLLENLLNKVKETDSFPDITEIREWIRQNFDEQVVNKVFEEYKTDMISALDIQKLKDSIRERVDLTIEGWATNWLKYIHPHYQVIDVEKVVFAPVMFNKTGFKDKVGIIREKYQSDIEPFRYKYISRLLRTAESLYTQDMSPDCITSELYEIEMPYYKVGKIDVVLLHREYNSLWVLDHKTTKSPQQYEKKTQFDLQLSGYCNLLRYHLKNGDFDHIKGKGPLFVGGVIWDICSSDINQSKVPKPLKSGKFSKSASRCPPSWLLKRELEQHGTPLEDYQDFYELCKSKDERFFIIKEVFISESEMDRIGVEDYATAIRISKTRKSIENIDLETKGDWDLKSPRFSVCTNYASCKFSTNCFANSKSNDIFLKRQQKLSWIEYE